MRGDRRKHGKRKRNGVRWWWLFLLLVIIAIGILLATFIIPPFDQLGAVFG